MKNKLLKALATTGVIAMTTGCSSLQNEKNFIGDVNFLRDREAYPIVLKNDAGARVALCPKYQGRVMTSTMDGDNGFSCGWINYKLIESGKNTPHINAYGGEDRFWLGPEGGQFSIYFPKGADFTFENWQVPAVFDTQTWEVTDRSGDREIALAAEFSPADWSGNIRNIRLERRVRLLSAEDTAKMLGADLKDSKLKSVGYTTLNKVINKGPEAWTKETGAVSVWMLGMFKPSPKTVIVVPFNKDAAGTIVKDDYFGKIPSDRLKVDAEKGVIYFCADGDDRGKIGLNKERAKGVLGSYDAEHNILTIVKYTPGKPDAEYVNASWEKQKDPFTGDVVNAYNDGIPGPGLAKMGPFYELESSSPAAFLKKGESILHEHTTFHFSGEKAELDKIAQKTLGVTTDEITAGGTR